MKLSKAHDIIRYDFEDKNIVWVLKFRFSNKIVSNF